MTAPMSLNPLRPRGPGRAGFAGQRPDDEQQQGTARPANTFAGMQQRGVARPAPPAGSSYYQPSQAGGGSYYRSPQAAAPAQAPAPPSQPATFATYQAPADPNRRALTNSVGQLLAQPSAYQSDQLQRDYGTLNSQLGLDAQAGKRSIDETMARRGLHDSTLAGDAYGSLQKQQDVTRQNFANTYLDHEASDLATARANAIASALGVQTETANEGLAAFGANQASQKQAHDESMDVANLGLQTELGRGNLGVSQQNANTSTAAEQSTAANQSGQLALGNRSLDSSNSNASADRALQQMLGLGNLGIQQGQLTGTYNGQQTLAAKQSDQQYGLQQGELTGTFGGNQTLAAQEAAASNAAQVGQLTGSYQGAPTAASSQFNQQLNQDLQIAQMTNATAGKQIDAQTSLAKNQQLMNAIAAIGGGLTKDQVDQIMALMNGTTYTPPRTTPTPDPKPTPDPNPDPNDPEHKVNPNVERSVPTYAATTNYSPGGNRNQGGGAGAPTLTALPNYRNARFGSAGFTGNFGNAGYTGRFGNSGVQYADANGAPASTGGSGTPIGGFDQAMQTLLGMNVPPNGGGTPGSSSDAPAPAPNGQGSTPESNALPNSTSNLARPGETPGQTLARNTAYNPAAGQGPSSVGVNYKDPNDPMARYARGEIDSATMRTLVDQQNASRGEIPLGSLTSAMQNNGLSSANAQLAVQSTYRSLMDTWMNSTHQTEDQLKPRLLETLAQQANGDPTALAVLKTMGYQG